MNISKMAATSLCLFCVLNSANAEWTGPGSIGDFNIHSDAGGDAVRITHDAMKNPAGCANGAFLELRASEPAFQEMYSLLLAAKTADRKVDIYLSDTACTTGGHPMISQVSYNQVAGSGLVDSLPTATPALDGLMSAADKAKLDSLPNGPLQTGSQVAVLTGTVSHGGTIPLPAGYTEAQCNWRVFPTQLPRNMCFTLPWGKLPLDISLNGRVVSVKVYASDSDGGCSETSLSALVDYLNICVK